MKRILKQFCVIIYLIGATIYGYTAPVNIEFEGEVDWIYGDFLNSNVVGLETGMKFS
jgi:hypothetical protein